MYFALFAVGLRSLVISFLSSFAPASGSWQCMKHQQIHKPEKLLCEIPFFLPSAQTYLVLNYSLDQEEKENSKDGAKEASEKHLF